MVNKEDGKLLKQLQKAIGRELRQRKPNDIARGRYNGYALDERGHVTGLNWDYLKLDAGALTCVSRFTHLEILNFAGTGLTDLSPLQGLTNLTLLDVMYNSIRRLPEPLMQLNMKIDVDTLGFKSAGMLLPGNPLESPPPEIIRKGKDAIRHYFKSLETGTTRPLNEVKVILVGDGAAGKTSLAKHILHAPFDLYEKQTEGITIKKWQTTENINVRLWDFGGQEILHATHQFFLSKRSLYILVLDGRKDEKTEYWLQQIESFGKQSPVLVVMNKIDQNPHYDVNRNFLLKKYPNILGFHRLSCLDNNGVEDFIHTLRQSLHKVPLTATLWSEKWFAVKTRLEDMSESFITYDRYRQICKKEGVGDQEAQSTLVEFLNDLGVVLHFKDLHLTGTHVLDPEWVTNAVYKITNPKHHGTVDGVLPVQNLHHLLQPCKETNYCYPPESHGFILGLMTKFELCYFMDKDHILIPALLPKNEKADEPEGDDVLRFIFRYQFFPPSIMPRFIVRMKDDIQNNLRWRTGVVLANAGAYKNTMALVKADVNDKKITVWVKGDLKRDYFQVIRKTLADIHGTFENLEVNELIPLPGEGDYTVSYGNLVGYEIAGKSEYFNGELGQSYSVRQLLNGVVSQEKRLEHYEKTIPDFHGLPAVQANNVLINTGTMDLSKSKTKTNIKVNINIKQELPDLQDTFAQLRKLLKAGAPDPDVAEEIKELGDGLDALLPGTDKKQLAGPISKLRRFLTDLADEDSTCGKVLAGTQKGIETAQKLAGAYNKIGQWLGLPHIPDVLLGKGK
ncbi:MAG: GTP-binding protein [bacterium]|nr:GTP-binding protein [bacterium]